MKKINVFLSILLVLGFLGNSIIFAGGACSKGAKCCEKDHVPDKKYCGPKILVTSPENNEPVVESIPANFIAFKFDGSINKGSDKYKYLEGLDLPEYRSVDLRKVRDFKSLKELLCFHPSKYRKFLPQIVNLNHEKYSKKSVVGAKNIFDAIDHGNLNEIYKFVSQINLHKKNDPLKGSSPLLYAISNKASLEVISILLLLGADVKEYEKDGDGRNLILFNFPTEDMYYCRNVLEMLLACRLDLTDKDIIRFPHSKESLFLTKFKKIEYFTELYQHFMQHPNDRKSLLIFPFINDGVGIKNKGCIVRSIFDVIDEHAFNRLYEFRSQINGIEKEAKSKFLTVKKQNIDCDKRPLFCAIQRKAQIRNIVFMLLLGADVNLKQNGASLIRYLNSKDRVYSKIILNIFLSCGLNISEEERRQYAD